MSVPTAKSKGEETFALHLSTQNLFAFREYMFHKNRKWRFDFAFAEAMLAVEIDGGTWQYGRHNRPSAISEDMEKLNEAAILGWKVLRFTTDQVMSGLAIDTTLRALGRPPR
jgi:very-short-patch-repair endonuclease